MRSNVEVMLTILFLLFTHGSIRKLKMPLKGIRFQNREEIKRNVINILVGQSKSRLQKIFPTLENSWKKCINSKGAYFEENYFQVLR